MLVLPKVGEAEQSATCDCLPAASLVARRVLALHRLLFLLSEEESLPGMDLRTDTLNEVLVRNMSISVSVKEVEDDLTLGFSQREPPVLQEED